MVKTKFNTNANGCNVNNLIIHPSNHVSKMIRTLRIGLACNLVFPQESIFILYPIIHIIPQSVIALSVIISTWFIVGYRLK